MEKSKDNSDVKNSSSTVKKPKLTHIFSCIGVADRAEGRIVNIGKLSKDEPIKDSYICTCVHQAKEIDAFGYIYACNIDDKYLKNDTKNKSLPMYRFMIFKKTNTSQFKLIDFSAWFIPENPQDIKLKKVVGSTTYADIIIKGTFKFRAITFNDGDASIKDTIWFDGPRRYSVCPKDYIEHIRTHPKLLEIIDQEWDAIKATLLKTTKGILEVDEDDAVDKDTDTKSK